MSQYDNLMGTTRLPRRQRDELVYGHQRNGRHIFVTRNGHVSDNSRRSCVAAWLQTFKVPVFDTQGDPLGTEQLVKLLRDEVLPRSNERNNEAINLMYVASTNIMNSMVI